MRAFLIAIVCVLTVTVVRAAEKAGAQATNAVEEVFTLPDAWHGTKAGTTNGNPFLVDGKALWRADRLWPDNALAGDDYVVMEWDGYSWAAKENSYGGQPAISVGNDSAILSGMSPATAPGGKIPALIFIAPTNGTYKVDGTISIKKSQGINSPVSLMVYKLKLKKKGKSVSKVQAISLPHGKEQDLHKISAKLETGDELAFVPQFSGAAFQADFALQKLKIVLTQ